MEWTHNTLGTCIYDAHKQETDRKPVLRVLLVKISERDYTQLLDDDDAGDADAGLDGEKEEVHGKLRTRDNKLCCSFVSKRGTAHTMNQADFVDYGHENGREAITDNRGRYDVKVRSFVNFFLRRIQIDTPELNSAASSAERPVAIVLFKSASPDSSVGTGLYVPRSGERDRDLFDIFCKRLMPSVS